MSTRLETKPGASLTSTGVFSSLHAEVADGFVGGLRSGQAADDFDQLHDGHGIEKVHADDFVGTFGEGGDFGDRDRRRVRGEDDFGLHDAVEVAEDLGFDFEFLRGCLDDEIARGELRAIEDGCDSAERGGFVVGGNFVLGDFAVEVPGDGFEAAIQKALFDIA